MNSKFIKGLYIFFAITAVALLAVQFKRVMTVEVIPDEPIMPTPILQIATPTEYIIDESEITDQSEVEIPADWKTYTDDKFGFQIRYPSDWFISIDKYPFPYADQKAIPNTIRTIYVYNSKKFDGHSGVSIALASQESELNNFGYNGGMLIEDRYWNEYKKFRLFNKIFWRGFHSYDPGDSPYYRPPFYFMEDKSPVTEEYGHIYKSFSSISQLNETLYGYIKYSFFPKVPYVQEENQGKIDIMDKIIMSSTLK